MYQTLCSRSVLPLGSKIIEKSIQNVLEKVMQKRLRRRWVKKRILNPGTCGRKPIQVPGRGYGEGKPSLEVVGWRVDNTL